MCVCVCSGDGGLVARCIFTLHAARCTWHVRSDCNLVEGLGMSALSYGYCASMAHRWHDAKYLGPSVPREYPVSTLRVPRGYPMSTMPSTQ